MNEAIDILKRERIIYTRCFEKSMKAFMGDEISREIHLLHAKNLSRKIFDLKYSIKVLTINKISMDIDKTLEVVKEGKEIFLDTKEALKDEKITFVEGAGLVLKHGLKAVKIFSSIGELADEFKDIDPEEAEDIVKEAIKATNLTDEQKEAVVKIIKGSVLIKEGICALV